MTAVTTGERLFLRATSPRIGDRISEIDIQKEAQLLSFFLARTADERCDRFGRIVADDFIREWRAGLTASRYCAVGPDATARSSPSSSCSVRRPAGALRNSPCAAAGLPRTVACDWLWSVRLCLPPRPWARAK